MQCVMREDLVRLGVIAHTAILFIVNEVLLGFEIFNQYATF